MTYALSINAKKQLQKLPRGIQKKFTKQLRFLLQDPKYPSLQAKKKSGSEDFEARIDYHYRFTYVILGSEINIITIGPHDDGLGKK